MGCLAATPCTTCRQLDTNEPQVSFLFNRGFGIGKKTDFDVGKDPHNIAPPPNTYDIPTFVQENERHKSGFNIAIGRELIDPVSYIPLEPKKV